MGRALRLGNPLILRSVRSLTHWSSFLFYLERAVPSPHPHKDRPVKHIIPIALLVSLILVGVALSGCDDDAVLVSHNLSKAADNFEIHRRIVFYNGITGEYMLTIEGACSIQDQGNQLEVTVRTGEDSYKKHFLGLSDNVTYFAEQVDAASASKYHYRVTFKPSVIIPDVDVR